MTEDVERDRLFGRVLRHAITAGACRLTARENPEAARGLTKAADKHSNEVAALLEDWLGTREGDPLKITLPAQGGRGQNSPDPPRAR